MQITVLTKTKAKREKVEKIDDSTYSVAVKVPPQQGRANKAVIKSLAKYFQTRKNRIFLVAGFKSSVKKFTIV